MTLIMVFIYTSFKNYSLQYVTQLRFNYSEQANKKQTNNKTKNYV